MKTTKDMLIVSEVFRSSIDKLNITGIVFSTEGAKGRTPILDLSFKHSGEISAYWENQEERLLCVSTSEPGYMIKAPIVLNDFFNADCWKSNLNYVDVSGLDVSNVLSFSRCFNSFGKSKNSKLVGYENWNVSKGIQFDFMFNNFYPFKETVNLDLSKWRFSLSDNFSMIQMFAHFANTANKVSLNLNGWNTQTCNSFKAMFGNFASAATSVMISGIENFKIKSGADMTLMFWYFASRSSLNLDLTKWSFDNPLIGNHIGFADETFFKIKKPVWEQEE